jgi:hypothetical protein
VCPERRALSDAAIKRRAIAYKCPTFSLVGRSAEVVEGAYEVLLSYARDGGREADGEEFEKGHVEDG